MAYVYAYIVDGVARYIGKGTGNRDMAHLKNAINFKEKSLFHSYLRKQLNSGKVPVIKRLISNVSDEVAYKYEEKFIKKIGKVIDKTGTLLNIDNGGRGRSKGCDNSKSVEKARQANTGRKHTKEAKANMSKGQIGRKHSVQHRKNNSNGQLGRKLSIETKTKISKASKGRVFTEEHKRKIGLASKGNSYGKGYKHTDKHKQYISDMLTGRIFSEETKLKMSIASKNKIFTLKHRKNIGIASKKVWAEKRKQKVLRNNVLPQKLLLLKLIYQGA